MTFLIFHHAFPSSREAYSSAGTVLPRSGSALMSWFWQNAHSRSHPAKKTARDGTSTSSSPMWTKSLAIRSSVVPAMVITGFGMGVAMPTFANWLAGAIPFSVLGKVMGVYSMCIYIGQFLSSLAAVPIHGLMGSYGGMFLLMGLLSVALAAAYLSVHLLRRAPSGTS